MDGSFEIFLRSIDGEPPTDPGSTLHHSFLLVVGVTTRLIGSLFERHKIVPVHKEKQDLLFQRRHFIFFVIFYIIVYVMVVNLPTKLLLKSTLTIQSVVGAVLVWLSRSLLSSFEPRFPKRKASGFQAKTREDPPAVLWESPSASPIRCPQSCPPLRNPAGRQQGLIVRSSRAKLIPSDVGGDEDEVRLTIHPVNGKSGLLVGRDGQDAM